MTGIIIANYCRPREQRRSIVLMGKDIKGVIDKLSLALSSEALGHMSAV